MRRALILVILISIACVSGYEILHKREIPELPSTIASGDVVLVNGRSVNAMFVRAFGGRFSAPVHIGILVVNVDGVQIIHADPRRSYGQRRSGVILERWDAFAERGEIESGQVFRDRSVHGEKIAAVALEYARKRIPFDWNFDWDDRSALYCTEFVDQVFKDVGVDLLSQSAVSPKIVLPDQVTSSGDLQFVSWF